ncbi:hypothetical protein [Flexithrix dorotheae]|uniref:hypothetical protein n=1 Tax=Flexithrix dorotheae TaxID=70993 RepID=UPI00037EDF67|nr:hypothetical protein [Flexithrix dorotheae]
MIDYGFIEEFPEECVKNLSGVQDLWLMENEYLQGYTDNKGVVTDLRINEDGNYKHIPIVKGNCFANENSQESPHGDIIDFSLKFSLSKDSDFKRRFSNKILGRQVSVVYLNRNGQYRFMPKVKCLPAQKTDQKGGRNSFDFNLIKRSSSFAFQLPNGIDNVIPVNKADFDPADFYFQDFYTA